VQDAPLAVRNRGSDADEMARALLPGLPIDLIQTCYTAAPGNEIASGKFASPDSSSALVANTFGLFQLRPADLPKCRAARHGTVRHRRCALRRWFNFPGLAVGIRILIVGRVVERNATDLAEESALR